MSYIVFGDSSDINLTNLWIIEFSTFIIFKAAVNEAAPRRTWSSLILVIDEDSFKIEVNLEKDARTEWVSKFNAKIQFNSGSEMYFGWWKMCNSSNLGQVVGKPGKLKNRENLDPRVVASSRVWFESRGKPSPTDLSPRVFTVSASLPQYFASFFQLAPGK